MRYLAMLKPVVADSFFCHAVCFGEGCFKAAIFRERVQARRGREKDKGGR